jgi:hypothetical protein
LRDDSGGGVGDAESAVVACVLKPVLTAFKTANKLLFAKLKPGNRA